MRQSRNTITEDPSEQVEACHRSYLSKPKQAGNIEYYIHGTVVIVIVGVWVLVGYSWSEALPIYGHEISSLILLDYSVPP